MAWVWRGAFSDSAREVTSCLSTRCLKTVLRDTAADALHSLCVVSVLIKVGRGEGWRLCSTVPLVFAGEHGLWDGTQVRNSSSGQILRHSGCYADRVCKQRQTTPLEKRALITVHHLSNRESQHPELKGGWRSKAAELRSDDTDRSVQLERWSQ